MNPIFIIQHTCLLRSGKIGGFLFLAASVLMLAAGTTSCSTTYGLGKDIEKTGDKIQDAATR